MLKEMIEEVAKANEGFYGAFESLDIKKMDEVWAKEDYVLHSSRLEPAVRLADRPRQLGDDLQQHLLDAIPPHGHHDPGGGRRGVGALHGEHHEQNGRRGTGIARVRH